MKLSPKLAALFSAALGFVTPGCVFPCMYGSPYADYEIKGLVTDMDDNPLENIEVVLGRTTGDGEFYNIGEAPLYTGKDGKFTVQFKDDAMSTISMKIGDNNRTYYPEIVTEQCIFEKNKKKKDSWYEGKATVEVNVKLTKRLAE